LKNKEESEPILAVLNFDQSVRGLSPGAQVDFRGMIVGQVRSIGIKYLDDQKRFRLPVTVELFPMRLGFRAKDLENKKHARNIVSALVNRGMRAQLRTGNLLTGQLYVALDFFPKAAPAKPNFDGPLPELATTPGGFDELQTQLGNIVTRIDKVPLDQIGKDLQTTIVSLNTMLGNADTLVRQLNGDVAPQVVTALQDVRKTLRSADGALAPDAPLQQDLRRMLQELTRSAASLRTLTDYLERHPEALLRGKTDQEK
jgi:paraquat-inducible protein B